MWPFRPCRRNDEPVEKPPPVCYRLGPRVILDSSRYLSIGDFARMYGDRSMCGFLYGRYIVGVQKVRLYAVL